jgi:hypothetical protein
MLSPYVMCDSARWSQFYNLFNRLIEAVQGLMVAMIYCFFNGEVTSLLRQTLCSMKMFSWIKKSNDLNFDQATGDFDLAEQVNFLDHPIVRIKRSIFRKSSTLTTVDSRLNSARSSPHLKKNETQI